MSCAPNQTKRKMPTERAVRLYWAERISKAKGLSSAEIIEGGCFACGFSDLPCERAHIKSRVDGGSDDVENIHMLCVVCHKDSEFVSGEKYWRWLTTRCGFDVVISMSYRMGRNFWGENPFNTPEGLR